MASVESLYQENLKVFPFHQTHCSPVQHRLVFIKKWPLLIGLFGSACLGLSHLCGKHSLLLLSSGQSISYMAPIVCRAAGILPYTLATMTFKNGSTVVGEVGLSVRVVVVHIEWFSLAAHKYSDPWGREGGGGKFVCRV